MPWWWACRTGWRSGRGRRGTATRTPGWGPTWRARWTRPSSTDGAGDRTTNGPRRWRRPGRERTREMDRSLKAEIGQTFALLGLMATLLASSLGLGLLATRLVG